MKRTKRNEGVALIVVLGFLSLMLVLAVAFLGEARTERVVSDYSLEAIRARQLMRAALAAAQHDYSYELNFRTQRTGQSLPDEDLEVFLSEANGRYAISGEEGTLGGSGVVITNGEILDWMPARYKTRDVFEDMEDAEWILVREDPRKDSRILGRYAYICLDSSGGLDANWVAREDNVANRDTARSLTNRPHHSIREVPMGLLPEVADASEFKRNRKGWKGFDSLQTLAKLTDGNFVDGNENPSRSSSRWQPDRIENGPALVSNLVSDLTCYSLTAYRGGRYNFGSGDWKKPNYMDPATMAGWEAVLAPLQGQGWSKTDMEKQLQDYLSSSRAPQGVDYPSIKAVPMFNEMWVKLENFKRSGEPVSQGDESTYTYSAKVTVGIETWFPFPSQDNDGGSYTLKAPTLSLQSSSGGGGQILIPVRLQTTDGPVNMQSVSLSSTETVEIKATYGKPQPYTFTYEVKDWIPAKAVRDPNATLQWGARGMVWQVTGDIDLLDGGKAVDRLPKNIRGEGNALPLPCDGNGERGPFSMEVTDPRLNHLASEWQAPDTDAGTPGEINSVTKGLPDFQKEGPWMYCRNGKMESLAEFGFFSTGKPWKTIDLCTAEGKEFLALGTMDKALIDDLESEGVHYTNATININTYRTNVLASAFYDLSFMPTPNTDASKIEKENAFTEEQARRIAQLIQQETADKSYQSGMDWANSPAMKDGGYLDASLKLTRTERESVLRNTDGLFSVSDSLFTVILIAQSIKEGPDQKNVGKWDSEDQVTGERRAVALVWRDPMKPNTSQYNEMWVRMFRFLND